jgi:hypothetical protein
VLIAEYWRRQSGRTPVQVPIELAEAQVADGPGVELVNIFTLERFIS